MHEQKLFIGQPIEQGGLSNENQLAQLCPMRFKVVNAWSHYVVTFFHRNGSTHNWKWKTKDHTIREHQQLCLELLLNSQRVKGETKRAVAGWMLSQMLSEVPACVYV